MAATKFLQTEQGRSIAYHFHSGRGPTVVFLGGLKSDMEGTKAIHLEAWAHARGQAFLRFDYSGHGESSGTFEEGCLGDWHQDTLAAVQALTTGKIVPVGSSMGGWLMLLAAQKLGQTIAGLVGIAAAPDFTQWGFSDTQKVALAAGETIYEDSDYGYDPMPTHAGFWADGQAQLQLTGEITLDCPVRLLHGQEDADVPCDTSLRLAAALRSEDVQVTLVKGGDHRLSRGGDIPPHDTAPSFRTRFVKALWRPESRRSGEL